MSLQALKGGGLDGHTRAFPSGIEQLDLSLLVLKLPLHRLQRLSFTILQRPQLLNREFAIKQIVDRSLNGLGENRLCAGDGWSTPHGTDPGLIGGHFFTL